MSKLIILKCVVRDLRGGMVYALIATPKPPNNIQNLDNSNIQNNERLQKVRNHDPKLFSKLNLDEGSG